MTGAALPDWHHFPPQCWPAIEAAATSLGRLDRAVESNPLRDAWLRRGAYAAAVRCLAADGHIFELERLFALTGGLPVIRARDFGQDARALQILQRVQSGAWLHAAEDASSEPELGAALEHLGRTAPEAPALVSVALGAREWSRSGQGPSGLMAALPGFLSDRGLTARPLPWLAGCLQASLGVVASYPAGVWASRALRELAAGAAAGIRDLDALVALWRSWHAKLGPRRRTSHLAEVVDLLVAQPLLSPVQVARVLRLSLRGASKLLAELQALGIVVPPTSRRSWRVFAAADLGAITLQLHHRPVARVVSPPPPAVPSEVPPLAAAPPPRPIADEHLRAFQAAMTESDTVVRRIARRLAGVRAAATDRDRT